MDIRITSRPFSLGQRPGLKSCKSLLAVRPWLQRLRKPLSEKDKKRIAKAGKGKKLAQAYVNRKGVRRVCGAYDD